MHCAFCQTRSTRIAPHVDISYLVLGAVLRKHAAVSIIWYHTIAATVDI